MTTPAATHLQSALLILAALSNFGCTCGRSGFERRTELDAATNHDVMVLPPFDVGTSDVAVAPSFFDNCGGRIFNAAGTLNVDEYRNQANAWSREVLDCRFGPKFADVYGNAQDDRPTVYEPPRIACTSPPCGAAYPRYYQLGNPVVNEVSFGVLTGQAAYFPDEANNVGLDEFWSFSWANSAIVEEPWMSSRPARYTYSADWAAMCSQVSWQHLCNSPEWGEVYAAGGHRTIAVHRSQLGDATGAIALFQSGHLGGIPDYYGSSTNAVTRLPDGFVPTAIATSNELEFAFVTAWNVNTQTGHLFVIAIGDALPELFVGRAWQRTTTCLSDHSCNWDLAPFKILGQIELPIHTPTAIDVSFDNGAGHGNSYLGPRVNGNIFENGLDYSTQSVRDSLQYPNGSHKLDVAHSGYAVVLSRWENKAVFIDLQALVQLSHRYFAGTQQDYETARNNRGNRPDQWPYAFSVAPEQTPRVVATIDIPHPTTVLCGRFGNFDIMPAKTHIASLDGTIRTFNVSGLGTPSTTDAQNITPMSSLQVGANPVRMQWLRAPDPSAPPGACPEHYGLSNQYRCDGVSQYEFNSHFAVLSRAGRELTFVVTDDTESRVYRRLRDSRMEDPVNFITNPMDVTMLFSIADWTNKRVTSYRFTEIVAACTPALNGPVQVGGGGVAECAGSMSLPGNVYSLSTANVP